MKTIKDKKCRSCKELFSPRMPMQVACSPSCALSIAVSKREKEAEAVEKKERAKHREARAKIKTKSQHMKEAQAAFNAFIRERDRDLPCISCERHHGGQYHAGHYLSVGARPELRFVELNVYKQCSVCNNHLSGNLILYRKNLIDKIGQDNIDWLEGPHEAKRYNIEDLELIKKEYRAKKRNLERSREPH